MGFFIRPTKTGFRIVEEQWTPERQTKTVPRESYPTLGFRYDMTLDEAKARAIQINKQSQLESKKIAGAARRVAHSKVVNEVYLPPKLVELFKAELDATYDDNRSRLNTILKHWTAVETLISKLEIDPKDFFNERAKILNYYRKEKWSPDYIKRINRMLNLWGAFCARRNNSFFQPIPKLTGTQVQRVIELREASPEAVRTPATPLPWLALKAAKGSFENESLIAQWNWLFIALWFGLRPTEVDNLKNQKYWNIEKEPSEGLEILNIYQTKLTSLSKDKRWKPIPVFLPEQKEALKLIKSGVFKRPLIKTMARLIKQNDKPIEGIETYSPRKAFTDLMLERGFNLEDISIFLGHNNIDTTWRHYKNKKKFKLPKAS